MLDEFGTELETTESKLDSTMKKVAKVLHMSNGLYSFNESGSWIKFSLFLDSRQWTAIVVLSVVLIIVIALFIIV